MLLLPAPLQPANTKICGLATAAANFCLGTFGPTPLRCGLSCCWCTQRGGRESAQLLLGRVKRPLHCCASARRLHQLESAIKLRREDREGTILDLRQHLVVVERDQHRCWLALLGDRHWSRAQRGIEQLPEVVLGFAG